MRVILLCTHYHEGGGGAEVLTHHIAIGLRERGYDVEISLPLRSYCPEKIALRAHSLLGQAARPSECPRRRLQVHQRTDRFPARCDRGLSPFAQYPRHRGGGARLCSGAGRIATRSGGVLPGVAEVAGPRFGLVVRLYEKYRRRAHFGQDVR